jgi:hypothetical protein
MNDAGVPMEFVRCHRQAGHYSRLVSWHANPTRPPEEIVLGFPGQHFWPYQAYQELVQKLQHRRHTRTGLPAPFGFPPLYTPRTALHRAYVRLRDRYLDTRIRRAIRENDLESYDIYHLDNGLDFYRDGRWVAELKRLGKKIICCYYGTDLRLRGVVPEVDGLSDCNLTLEFDHLSMHPDIHYIMMPFDNSRLPPHQPQSGRIRIVHCPTRRDKKGTERIIIAVQNLRPRHPVELVLVEGKSQDEAVAIKATCHISIDQVGNQGGTGYGRNSLEALAMGLPCVTEFTPEYERYWQEKGGHPFLLATENTLESVLENLIRNPDLRTARAAPGRDWVERNHSFDATHRQLDSWYRRLGCWG